MVFDDKKKKKETIIFCFISNQTHNGPTKWFEHWIHLKYQHYNIICCIHDNLESKLIRWNQQRHLYL